MHILTENPIYVYMCTYTVRRELILHMDDFSSGGTRTRAERHHNDSALRIITSSREKFCRKKKKSKKKKKNDKETILSTRKSVATFATDFYY